MSAPVPSLVFFRFLLRGYNQQAPVLSLKSHSKNLFVQKIEGKHQYCPQVYFQLTKCGMNGFMLRESFIPFPFLQKCRNIRAVQCSHTRASLGVEGFCIFYCSTLVRLCILKPLGKGSYMSLTFWSSQTAKKLSSLVNFPYNLPNSFTGSLCRKPWALCKANRRHQKWLLDPVKQYKITGLTD